MTRMQVHQKERALPQPTIKLDESWLRDLQGEFNAPYMRSLREFLVSEKKAGKVIFPPGNEIFNALNLTPLGSVKVVILGQDPYHGDGQAMGLCFSVHKGVRIPPSLKNIYKEMETDLGIPPATHGDLTSWAQQGVLLLNSVMTVERGRAASHQGKGWEKFTDAVIASVNRQSSPVVFLLWGSYAQKKAAFVDTSRHLVLKGPHPSPLSAHTGFFGKHYFSKANEFLMENNITPIDWRLP
ncbi:MAG: uracil-DNA glycosylase [Acetobacter sp.]|nr:uracil-DNA glycosylase [Acetobacter sp.]MCH4060687.1 uracil-DNA glycosylase [Acetobacter sp.]MCH4087627.1 uracil-DNA glycosylase [Acetobacter sp.]MCI1294251.1 uracil-DNA glycosylase [Acetobacter sp.]MCI1320836.1 uracil-DNA glycosylase [Acetobacter sp.]